MSAWVKRSVLSGASTARNGTTSHTCTFTTPTSGNFIFAIVSGAVTFTTPTGWTLVVSSVNNSGLYVFSKTSNGTETNFTTTHNGSNYPILGVVYEYYSGTTVQKSGNGSSYGANGVQAGPAVTALTGTYSRFAARSYVLSSTSNTASTIWTVPGVEDYDSYIANDTNTDGDTLSIAYDDSQSATSFNPSAETDITSTSNTGEGIAIALNVVAAPVSNSATISWLRA